MDSPRRSDQKQGRGEGIPAASQRYDGLDALRAGAMLLGLAYHATYSWFPDIGRWYFVQDTSPVAALPVLAGFLHAFRMELFFALSGFFSHLVWERRGARGFLVDRSRRLLVPLVVALPLVLAADVGLRRWSQSLGLMAADFEHGVEWRAAPLHLWFLIYLFTCCAVAWALPAWPVFSRAVERMLRWPVTVLLAFTALTALGMWLHPDNRPDLVLWPLPWELLHFGLFFAFGWWLWPAREAVAALRRQAPMFAVAGTALGLFVFSRELQWQPLGHALTAVVAWLMTLAGFGLAFAVKSATRPGLRFLVEASYWVYLVHYPVVLVLQLGFAMVSWPGLLEYAIATVATLGFALISFEVFVRRSVLGPWLGAKR